jgi:predicted methyltransferase
MIAGFAAFVLGACLAGAATGPETLRVSSRFSLLHVPFFDEFVPSADERWAAVRTVTALAKGDAKSASEALTAYRRIEAEDALGTPNTGLRWLCDYVAAPAARQEEIRRDPYSAAFLRYWAADSALPLKQHVDLCFRGLPLKLADPKEAEDRAAFLDRLMRFDNPRRGDWERSADVLAALGLKEGSRVVDAAAGPGFYTMRFAGAVGATGRVYAVETEARSEAYLRSVLAGADAGNVDVVKGRADSIGVTGPVDVVFMASHYGEVYSTWTLPDRDGLLASIRQALTPEGTLAILDHGAPDQQPMPGRQIWVDKALVVAQLGHYGFDLVRAEQLNPQRYLLLFRKSVASPTVASGAAATLAAGSDLIQVNSRQSLCYLLTLPAFAAKSDAVAAGRLLLQALESQDRAAAEAALAIYARLVPVQNFGGEYTALQWFVETLLAPDAERQTLIGDRYADLYYHYFADADFAVLKEYLKRRYHLGTLLDTNPGEAQDRWTFLEDLILFNNPRREAWERTSKILSVLNLQPGQVIADVGSGPGYYTFQFAEKVGAGGRVYAIDINDRHHQYVKAALQKYGLGNIEIVQSRPDDICVTAKVDMAFLCSLYHVIYAMSSLETRDAFIGSIKKAMKPGGTLVVADNDVVAENEIPYHGPRIARELIVAQLRQYGFELAATHQFTPQRYVLTFTLAPQAPAPR